MNQGRKHRFPPHCRLRRKSDFAALRRGRRLGVGNLRLIWRPNGLGYARLGLAVSRKYGGAVRRNRLKRQLRECFRVHGIRQTGVDVLVIPTANWMAMRDPAGDLQRGLDRILRDLRSGRS